MFIKNRKKINRGNFQQLVSVSIYQLIFVFSLHILSFSKQPVDYGRVQLSSCEIGSESDNIWNMVSGSFHFEVDNCCYWEDWFQLNYVLTSCSWIDQSSYIKKLSCVACILYF